MPSSAPGKNGVVVLVQVRPAQAAEQAVFVGESVIHAAVALVGVLAAGGGRGSSRSAESSRSESAGSVAGIQRHDLVRRRIEPALRDDVARERIADELAVDGRVGQRIVDLVLQDRCARSASVPTEPPSSLEKSPLIMAWVGMV